MTCTIYKDVFDRYNPHYITIDAALERIQTGKSKRQVELIRQTIDKEKAAELKKNLPSVCFSGKFAPGREDSGLLEHSGVLVLDFDRVDSLRARQEDLINLPYVYACWISPSGNGLKCLIRVSDKNKHLEHFAALQDLFPDVDNSGKNVSRVCYESYDPEIYINKNATAFTTVKFIDQVKVVEKTEDEEKIFRNLLAWLSNKKEAFVTGERNNFIFKLASACCRFGIMEDSALDLITNEFLIGSDFKTKEAGRTVASAYRKNKNKFGDSCFEQEILVEKTTKKEILIDQWLENPDEKAKDVIYGIDVKDSAISIYNDGYEKVTGIGVYEFDALFKAKKGEVTLLSGYGNHGKSSLLKWYMIMRILLYKEKFAAFTPEDFPPHEYYHDLTEILLGCDCSKDNPNRPSIEKYKAAYDFITSHVFYVYPKELSPTPEYLKERFLELIVKEKIDGCIVDPFNQMSNDYSKFRTDQYLETLLGDFSRFAQTNQTYFFIVAHPNKGHKDTTGNYPCPDVFELAGGAMWNNKMDNILIYHRPFFYSDPSSPVCEFHSKKIKRQKTVGKRGFMLMDMVFKKRRFFFNGTDPMEDVLRKLNMDFNFQQSEIVYSDADEELEDAPF